VSLFSINTTTSTKLTCRPRRSTTTSTQNACRPRRSLTTSAQLHVGQEDPSQKAPKWNAGQEVGNTSNKELTNFDKF